MADYDTQWYSKYYSAVPRLPVPAYLGGIIHIRRIPTFTVPAGGIAASKTIKLLRMQAGEVLVAARLTISADGVASGAVLQLGDGTTATKYGAGSANAIDIEFMATQATGKLQTLAADVDLHLTTNTAGLVAAATLDFLVQYLPVKGNW